MMPLKHDGVLVQGWQLGPVRTFRFRTVFFRKAFCETCQCIVRRNTESLIAHAKTHFVTPWRHGKDTHPEYGEPMYESSSAYFDVTWTHWLEYKDGMHNQTTKSTVEHSGWVSDGLPPG